MRLTHPVTVLAFATLSALQIGISSAAPPSASNVGATDPRKNIEAEFGTLDTNGNQLIDRAEAQASKELEGSFDQMDKNNDGQLSESEFSGFERIQSGPTVSESKNEAVNEEAKEAKPNESWFTAPRHKPRDDEAARGREPR